MHPSRSLGGWSGKPPAVLAVLVVLLGTVGRTPASGGLIAPGATLVPVRSDSRFYEGPSWDTFTEKLYFSALSTNELFRLTPPDTSALWMSDTRGINGTYLANDGRLLCAQGSARRILSLRIGPNGPEDPIILAENPVWNAPNDLCQTPAGDIYFTTPDFGAQTTSKVYRLTSTGATTAVITDMPLCNGIIGSLDGSILYVSDSSRKWWRSYPVNPDGSVGAGSLFFNPSTPNQNDPDGMTIDEFGNLYFAGRGGFWIVSPDGQQLDMVAVPEFVTNLTFGGTDGRTLYITCDGKLYSLAMEVRGGRWHNVPEDNQPPAVNAGPDLRTTSRFPTAWLDGSVTDDGLPDPPGALTVAWSKVSGPGDVDWSAPTAARTLATFSTVGTYVLQLMAYDGIRSAIDQVTVKVLRVGDLDDDTSVDQDDVALFRECVTGSGNGPPITACELADIDADQDVDQTDFGLLQRCISGPGAYSDPHCAG